MATFENTSQIHGSTNHTVIDVPSIPTKAAAYDMAFKTMGVIKSVTAYKTPKNTLLTVIKAGIAKGANLWWQILALGFNAGIYIALGCALTIAVAGALNPTDSPGLKKLLAGAVFPYCLMLVVICGAELFTGNVMFLFSAIFAGQVKFRQLAKSWFFSYFGNLCGTLTAAYFLFHLSELFQYPYYQSYLFSLATAKTTTGWGMMVLRGIGCNYLVTIALWNAITADDIIGKIVGIWWPIFGFVAIGFEHSIANMFYIPLAIMEGAPVTTADFISWNLIPVTLGNIIGGFLFIAVQYLIYHPYIGNTVDLIKLHQGPKPLQSGLPNVGILSGGHIVPKTSDSIFASCAAWIKSNCQH